MALGKVHRTHTQAIRDILLEGPATCDEITDRVWMMYPAGPCIRKYRLNIDRERARANSSKTGYSLSIDEQHRSGARRLIIFVLINLVRRGNAVKEGDRYRLL
jgi:hypothetical protein